MRGRNNQRPIPEAKSPRPRRSAFSRVFASLAGLNAVLCSVAVYALCGGDLRVALLGAVVASAVLRMFAMAGLVPLAAGFVLVTWMVMALGWLQRRYFDAPPTDARTG